MIDTQYSEHKGCAFRVSCFSVNQCCVMKSHHHELPGQICTQRHSVWVRVHCFHLYSSAALVLWWVFFFYPLLNKKETHTNRFVVFLLISRSTERLMLCFVAVPKSRVFNSHSMILSISRRRRMPQSCTESQNLCSKKKQKTTSVVLSNWSIDQCLGKRPVSTLMGRYDNS